jgi:mono/diheme cytochrome c family protein
MIKTVKLVVLVLMVISCNSKEKKDNKVDYPEKTALVQTNPDLKASIERGKIIYGDMCITCHMANGKGVPKVFPPLASSDYLRDNQTKSILGIKNGMSGEILVNGDTYNTPMASLGLSDDEVADVVNFINNSWGNDYGKFLTTQEVTNIIKKQE